MAADARASHLVLVGIRGSGKTTLGRRLAQAVDAPFVDTDELVAETLGLSVAEIFAKFGEERFREAEREAVASLTGLLQPTVVATGGGVVLDEANRAALHRAGLVVWLDLPTEVAAARIADSDRPSLTGRPPVEELGEIAAMRRPLYCRVADSRLAATEPATKLVAELGRLWSMWRKESGRKNGKKS